MKLRDFILAWTLLPVPALVCAQTPGTLASAVGSGDQSLPNYVQLDRSGSDQCQWLSVEDATDYYIPVGFEARLATNNRNSGNSPALPSRTSDRVFTGTTANSIYLPFGFTLPSNVKGYNLGYYNSHSAGNNTDNTFVFYEQPTGFNYQANTPYLVVGDGTSSATIADAVNITVPASPVSVNRSVNPSTGTAVADPFNGMERIEVSDKSTPVNTWRFCGTTEMANASTVGDGGAWSINPAPAGSDTRLLSIWGDLQTKVIGAGNAWVMDANGVKAGRAFIAQVNGTAGAKISFGFQGVDGTVTGIDTINNEEIKNNNSIYTIDGRYVGKDVHALPKGIYIVNGKKVIK